MNKFFILALLFAGCMCLHHKLRSKGAPPFEAFSDEDECKIQRCISSEMAKNWEPINGKEYARKRQVQCFKTCHMVTCFKREGKENPKCSKDESGRVYPEDYTYEPPTSAFENHKDDKAAMDYLNNRNQ